MRTSYLPGQDLRSSTVTKAQSEIAQSTRSIPDSTAAVKQRILVELIHSYGDALCSQPDAKVDFNRLCAGTIEKILQGILGKTAASTFIRSLEKYSLLKIQEVGEKPELLVKCLRQVYGPSSDIIENLMAKQILEEIMKEKNSRKME